jgi:hypothetical protein
VESFVRRSVAEAAPRRCVQAGGDTSELVLVELGQVAITGQEPANSPIRILDRTFLPRAVRIAEIGLSAGGSRKVTF